MIVGEEEVLNERELLVRVESGLMMDSTDSVRYIILHCSATRCNSDYTVEQLLRDHRARGFRTIGYHFYVRRDGTVSQHRRLLEVGAHCRPFNRCSIGVCYEGGLDSEGHPADTLTPEQFENLEATQKMMDQLDHLKEGSLLLALISGGGSSLLSLVKGTSALSFLVS